jgi:hypothetical protein
MSAMVCDVTTSGRNVAAHIGMGKFIYIPDAVRPLARIRE